MLDIFHMLYYFVMKIMNYFENFIGEWASVLLTIRIHPNQTENSVIHGEMGTVNFGSNWDVRKSYLTLI
jgi:hypothetical protein